MVTAFPYSKVVGAVVRHYFNPSILFAWFALSLAILLFISEDFIFMCRQLNLEDSAEEIMQQLGMNSQSRISFNDFIRCRSHVMSEMEPPLYIEDTGMDSDNSGLAKQRTMATLTSWPTMSSDNSLGK